METVKKHLVLYLLAIIVALICLLSYESKMAKKYKTSVNALENTISSANAKTKVITIKLNDSIALKQAEVENLKITNKNLQSLYGELLKSSKTKTKDVQNLTQIGTVTTGIDTVICFVDSFGGLQARLVDQYANIKVDIDSARKAIIDYTVKDSLTIISYEKKHSLLFGLIKWKSFEGCKVITHNPKATPATVMSYSIIK